MTSKGLQNIVVGQTELSLVEGEKGQLIYRGYDIEDLAQHASFEQVAHLLWNGTPPSAEQLQQLDAQMSSQRALPDAVLGIDPAAGKARRRIVWLSAPVPHPTSSHRAPGGAASQARNSRATRRLQRLTAISSLNAGTTDRAIRSLPARRIVWWPTCYVAAAQSGSPRFPKRGWRLWPRVQSTWLSCASWPPGRI